MKLCSAKGTQNHKSKISQRFAYDVFQNKYVFFCNFQVALGGPPMKCMKTNHESIGNELCDAEFRPIFQWRCYISIYLYVYKLYRIWRVLKLNKYRLLQ